MQRVFLGEGVERLMAILTKTTQYLYRISPSDSYCPTTQKRAGIGSIHAFSTIELVVTLLIVTLLATFSASHLSRWLSVVKVNSAAHSLASDLQLGRMRAISENTRYRITFDTSGNAYQIHKDIAGEWQDVKPITPLPAGIDLEEATTNPIFFQTLGTVAAGSAITLRNMQNQRRRITISRSGRVNVKKAP